MNFNEAWYLGRYPDVAEGVVRGVISSGRDHYENHGKREGRLPGPVVSDSEVSPRVFACGAYGTNNVGDEAIFEGIRVAYPNVQQIYIDAPRVGGFKLSEVIDQKSFFRAGDRLIIGGGGLMFGLEMINIFSFLAKSVIDAGGVVDFLGVGCEGVQESFREPIRKLISLCSKVTVRSTKSADILQSIAGIRPEIQLDFANNLKFQSGLSAGSDSEIPLIGVVTGGDVRVKLDSLARVIYSHSNRQIKPEFRANFVHIPHSRSYCDLYNNDCAVGELLWSSVYTHSSVAFDEASLKLLPFSNSPHEVLRTYRNLDGVMTERFHGMIFSRLVGIPLLCLHGATIKNKSYIDDNPSPDFFAVNSENPIESEFHRFIAHVRVDKIARRKHLESFRSR